MTPSCQSCRFWAEYQYAIGECRRHAPNEDRTRQSNRIFPVTSDKDWCGEFAEKPAPIDPTSNMVCVSCKCGNLPKTEPVDITIPPIPTHRSYQMRCACGQKSGLYDTPARALEMWNAGHREGA